MWMNLALIQSKLLTILESYQSSILAELVRPKTSVQLKVKEQIVFYQLSKILTHFVR